MDLVILKKKISTFRSAGGKLRNIPDELLMEVLQAWETWTGPAGSFYEALGVDFRKMAGFIGRAKKLRQEGFAIPEFKEVQVQSSVAVNGPCLGAEIIWADGRVIRFNQVEMLLEFLKKAA